MALIDEQVLADVVSADRAWYLIFDDHVKVGIVVDGLSMTVDVPVLQVVWRRWDGTLVDYLEAKFEEERDYADS